MLVCMSDRGDTTECIASVCVHVCVCLLVYCEVVVCASLFLSVRYRQWVHENGPFEAFYISLGHFYFIVCFISLCLICRDFTGLSCCSEFEILDFPAMQQDSQSCG